MICATVLRKIRFEELGRGEKREHVKREHMKREHMKREQSLFTFDRLGDTQSSFIEY